METITFEDSPYDAESLSDRINKWIKSQNPDIKSIKIKCNESLEHSMDGYSYEIIEIEYQVDLPDDLFTEISEMIKNMQESCD